MEYIDSLPDEERVDGLSVMECMENNEFDKRYKSSLKANKATRHDEIRDRVKKEIKEKQ